MARRRARAPAQPPPRRRPSMAPPLLQLPSPQGVPDDPTLSCAACPAPVQGALVRQRDACIALHLAAGCRGGPQRIARARRVALPLTGDAGGEAEGR